MTAVELSQVTVRYGQRLAVTELDLSIPQGQQVAVIGPSGAGKSTLLRLINGTVPATSGSVRVLGREFAQAAGRDLRAVQRRVGTIHQQFDLVDELRVVHNVNAGHLGRWGFWRAGTSLIRPNETDIARASLTRVGLADRLDQRTSTLSGGEQQRVAIARVLVQRPAVLLADEPVASLDPARAAEVVALLREVSRTDGTTLVASLHDVGLARRGFDRILGMRHGRLALDTTPERLTDAMTTALYELDDSQPTVTATPDMTC